MTVAAIEDNLVRSSSTANNIIFDVTCFVAKSWGQVKQEMIYNCVRKGSFRGFVHEYSTETEE